MGTGKIGYSKPIVFALVCGTLALAANRASGPNVVFMLADDCTYLDMEVYGGQAKTPRLVQLATEGMTFTRCFQAAPMCSPTRHNLYTGLYPVKSGAWPNHTRVYPGTKSIAHYLKDAGYRVALSGKTHIAPKESFPFEYDDEFRRSDANQDNPFPAIEGLIRESKRDGNPFCLFACSNEPHTPYTKGDASRYPPDSLTLPPTWVDTEETRAAYSNYLAEITYFDLQCGKLLDLLKKYNIESDTLVIVASEQGSGFPFAKWTCYELGLASGMIARWPNKIAANVTSDAIVEYCDVTPTLLHAAGTDIPNRLDGRSFLPVLMGETKHHKKYTFGIHTTRGIKAGSDKFAIRSCGTATHRYIRNLHHESTFKNVVTREGGDKADFWTSWVSKAKDGDDHAAAMTRKYQHRPAEELYDVSVDPHCTNNLIDRPDTAAIVAELSQQLDRWMAEQGDTGDATEAMALSRQKPGRGKK